MLDPPTPAPPPEYHNLKICVKQDLPSNDSLLFILEWFDLHCQFASLLLTKDMNSEVACFVSRVALNLYFQEGKNVLLLEKKLGLMVLTVTLANLLGLQKDVLRYSTMSSITTCHCLAAFSIMTVVSCCCWCAHKTHSSL